MGDNYKGLYKKSCVSLIRKLLTLDYFKSRLTFGSLYENIISVLGVYWVSKRSRLRTDPEDGVRSDQHKVQGLCECTDTDR